MHAQFKRIINYVVALMVVAAAPGILNAGEQERLADINKILTAYRCLEKGKYRLGAPVVTKVSLGDYSDGISQIEGKKDLLDTPEEFITAAYYSDLDVINEVKDVIRKELPPGKIGALRLGSMWLRKCAEERGNCEKYGVAIDIIKERSEISEQAIHDYFSKAMENEIKALAAANSSTQLPQKTIYNELCQPIITYYILPDNENENNLVNTGVKLFKASRLKAEGFTTTMIKLNEKFASRVISRIHEKRSNRNK